MSDEQVSTMARLYAERLMRGDTVSEAEMRVIIAGLMLSVDKLANAFQDMQSVLWSEDKLRGLVADEIEKHCRAKGADATCESGTRLGRWLARVLGGFFG